MIPEGDPRRRGAPDPHAVTQSLDGAERICRERGLQFTKMRRTVLETLMREWHPMSAYTIMRHLEDSFGKRISPPTVYRALEFLLGQHFISRIESKNAFVACAHPDHPHACVFFICEICGTSAEIENPGLEKLFVREASSLGFHITKRVVELQGTCATCRSMPRSNG